MAFPPGFQKKKKTSSFSVSPSDKGLGGTTPDSFEKELVKKPKKVPSNFLKAFKKV